MNGCQLTAFITTVANALAQNATVEQIELLSAIFNQLGETLETIATVRSTCSCEQPCDPCGEERPKLTGSADHGG